jgi:SSS family solute:Na+ symporter
VLENAVKKGSPTVVAASLSGTPQVLVLLVMMTSSLSTLDSTFTATGKLFALEFGGWFKIAPDARPKRGPLKPTDEANIGRRHVAVARAFMALLATVSTVYLLAESQVLKATTVSGTMVMGLGPPIFLMLFWRYASSADAADGWRQSPLAFLCSFFTGVTFGALYQSKDVDVQASLAQHFALGQGSYAKLLGVNVYGLLCCCAACLLGFAIDQTLLRRPRTVREPDVEHHLTGESVPVRAPARAATELAAGPAANDALDGAARA